MQARREETAMTATEHSTPTDPAKLEKATFGAGCFWKPEATFRRVPGVVATAVGYEGGHVDNPTYEQVCTGTTGHAEVTQVTFDPVQVSYEQLLERFWEMHDPTQVDRQGPDVGSQYRTVIFFHSPEQQAAAEASRDAVAARHGAPIATSVEPATGFWEAEEYHQCYVERRSGSGLLGSLLGR
jgi:peptide-methionine (S)-S-oxide reductase